MATNLEKQHSGKVYYPNDESIMKDQLKRQQKLKEYNNMDSSDIKGRFEMLKTMFAEMGEDSYIEQPFYANHGGHYVHLGKHVYANYGITFVDDTHIYVGDHTEFGPNVTLATAGHPIEPSLRVKGYQYNLPIHIGTNCWLGAGVVVMPGVTIGDNTVIGAGSIVTKDIPANVVAYGNPCKVQRQIGEKDKVYYYKDKKINYEDL